VSDRPCEHCGISLSRRDTERSSAFARRRFCNKSCSLTWIARRRPPKHGLSYEPEYRAWQTMRLRCLVPTNPAFADYGGRGITVCSGWRDSPAAFMADMGPKPTPKHEIDRRHNDLGYWCGRCEECVALGRAANCQWVTRAANDRNRRSNAMLTHRGETLALVEWSERTGVRADTITSRIEHGWSVERALETPARAKRPNGAGRAKIARVA